MLLGLGHQQNLFCTVRVAAACQMPPLHLAREITLLLHHGTGLCMHIS
jgi:hypothetical protein